MSRRVRKKKLQENVILYITMIIYTLQIIPRYMNNETKLHRHCSWKTVGNNFVPYGAAHLLLILNMQQASFLKVWITPKERCPQEALLKHLTYLKWAQRSIYFLLEQQVSDFDSSKNKFQIFLSENKKFVRDILDLNSPIISLCVKMNTSICIPLPERGSLLLLETNVP